MTDHNDEVLTQGNSCDTIRYSDIGVTREK
jgi:hypothetical protein